MRALIDTCIVIDALQAREPFAEAAQQIFLAVANKRVMGFLTAKSAADIYYITHRHTHNDCDTRRVLGTLFNLFELLDTAGMDCRRAISSELTDYEDAMMVETALRCGMDCIVTRNGEQARAQFSDQLVALLGKGQTFPVFGNTDILNRALVMLFPLKKRMKARRLDLLRALLSLPVSFVKEGSKHYGWLVDHGYTPIEIAYANVAALCSQCVPGGPGRNSLTAEKLVVSLFRTVLAHDKPLSAEVYQQLSQIYQMYAKFDIKCYEKYRLAETLTAGVRIQAPETMAWFIRCTGEPLHPATLSFDVMDPKWDSLAGSLDLKHYMKLFESCLTEDMDAAQIRERLDRYQVLTQKNFLERYSEDAFAGRFPLMVKTGIIDLWTSFQSCLSEDGDVSNSTLLRHIGGYCHDIQTLQAVEFLAQFLPQYGFQGAKTYFGRYQDGFEDELWAKKGYKGSVKLVYKTL